MAEKSGKILIVDDDEDILVAGKLLLKRYYDTVVTCNKPEHISQLMESHDFCAILLDMNFGPGESSGEQGFYWLDKILTIDPEAVVLMITAHGDMEMAVDAIKKGATDFISKPWQNEKVIATLSAGVKLYNSREETKNLKKTNQTLVRETTPSAKPMLGNSVVMNEVLNLISRSAPTEANVLILGENGTGKELAAREIHRQSKRANNIFMSVDLGSISETLFESELFGHKKGAFTDAREDRVGRLQAANGGTLFLDEIGNLPIHLQAKLLSVLEQRKVSPVGSDHAVSFDVRVIAATNLATEKLHDDTIFRQDLLFRLNTVEITLPPLCDRAEDIPIIAKHYAKQFCQKYAKPVKSFPDDIMQLLTAYRWPGNIRALKHAIERAVILSQNESFEAGDFQLDTQINSNTNTPTLKTNENGGLNLEKIERAAIEQALKKHSYNISHTSKELGLTRAALYRRMEKHGL